jgi:large subunit ribosomal protein L20
MTRARNVVPRKKRHKRVLEAAKGYRGGRRRLYRTASETVMRAQRYSFRDRRVRKREMRSLWIIRIGAACKQRHFQYSRLVNGLAKANVKLDRKMLAEIAVSDPTAFDAIVETAKQAIGK